MNNCKAVKELARNSTNNKLSVNRMCWHGSGPEPYKAELRDELCSGGIRRSSVLLLISGIPTSLTAKVCAVGWLALQHAISTSGHWILKATWLESGSRYGKPSSLGLSIG